MKRFFFKAVGWTAIPILLIFYLQILTGLVAVKGVDVSKWTLGLVTGDSAYSFHVDWVPLLLIVLFLGHGATGLQVWIRRRKALQDKSWLHAAVLVVDLLLALLLLVVYLA